MVHSECRLTGSQIGLLLSRGLVGTMLGSALLSPLADQIGRRPLTLVCLGLATAGMTLSALCSDHGQLGLCCFLTGVSLGGMMRACR